MSSASAGAREPSRELPRNPLLRLFLATRPAFLTITAVAVILGLACAWHTTKHIDILLAATTLLFALFAHAGANSLNDFYDVDTDALNSERVFPFTGGSRFIQNGVLSRRSVGILGYSLLASVIPAGLWLLTHVGAGLLGIGGLGLFIAWCYSAPPFRLSAHGLGELAITCGWALIVIGTDYVQRAAISPATVAAGIAFGLMVANLLYINQFPDYKADALAGKRTWVVRLGRPAAVTGYAIIAMASFIIVVMVVAFGLLKATALISLLALLYSGYAYRQLGRYAQVPDRLLPAIKATILATHLFGLFLSIALII